MRGGAEAGAGPLSLIPGLFVSLWSLMSLTVWLSFPGYLFDTVGGASAKLQAHSLLSTVPAGQAGQPGHAPREMGQGCVSWDMAPWVRGVLGSELEQPPPVFIFFVGEAESMRPVRAALTFSSWSSSYHPEV